MKKILILLPFFLLFSCADVQKKFHQLKAKWNKEEVVASEEFVQGSEDIPLLVGMEKISDGALGFDSAAGSIISSSYSSNIQKAKIKEFYLQTLPQMGWKTSSNAENSLSFKREKENLEIEFADEDQLHVVRFFVSSLTE